MKRLLWLLLASGCGRMIPLHAQTQPIVVQTTVACATSTDGSVVGLPNPLNPPIVAAGFSGSLGAGNYYTQIGWYDAAGHVTLVGPEVQTQLTATGNLTINLPASGIPSAAVGMKVYIGASSGTETLQGQTTGFATFTQSTPLTTGAAEPTVNNTICAIVANDAGWPAGTGYQVSMTTPAGDTIPGYPQQWQLLGPGQTINLGQGIPLYNGTVTYGSTIQARPYNHGAQSISGPLSMTGYALTQIYRLGVGTTVPGWPIDVENGPINTNAGYIYNGGLGVTTGMCLVAGSDAYKTFVAAACPTPTPATLYYQTTQAAGSSLPQEVKLNILGSLSAVDNSGNGSTDIALPAVGTAGTYASPASITFDGFGRETAVTASSAVNRVCNSNGCYRTEPDGTIVQWGPATGCGSGGACSTAVTFPTPFTTTTNLSVTVSLAVGNSSWLTTAVGHTTTGFTVMYGPLTFVGGSGVNLDGSERATWIAIGN